MDDTIVLVYWPKEHIKNSLDSFGDINIYLPKRQLNQAREKVLKLPFDLEVFGGDYFNQKKRIQEYNISLFYQGVKILIPSVNSISKKPTQTYLNRNLMGLCFESNNLENIKKVIYQVGKLPLKENLENKIFEEKVFL